MIFKCADIDRNCQGNPKRQRLSKEDANCDVIYVTVHYNNALFEFRLQNPGRGELHVWHVATTSQPMPSMHEKRQLRFSTYTCQSTTQQRRQTQPIPRRQNQHKRQTESATLQLQQLSWTWWNDPSFTAVYGRLLLRMQSSYSPQVHLQEADQISLYN